MAELVDASDLGSGVLRRAGSSPVRRTYDLRDGIFMCINLSQLCFFDKKTAFLIKKIKKTLHN